MRDENIIRGNNEIEKNYTPGNLTSRLSAILKKMDINIDNLKAEDLAPVEDLHLRGREGTIELLKLTDIKEGNKVLDLGCGIGGTCRYIAAAYKCMVTGIDLSAEFISTAEFFTKKTGLDRQITFIKGDAAELPFEEEEFDHAVTVHAQMNIKNKTEFLAEVCRVLKKGGSFAFYDIFRTGERSVYFPVPWADTKEISFLETWEKYAEMLKSAGFRQKTVNDVSVDTQRWFSVMFEKTKQRGGFPEHSRVIIGDDAQERMANVSKSLNEGIIKIIQGVYIKD